MTCTQQFLGTLMLSYIIADRAAIFFISVTMVNTPIRMSLPDYRCSCQEITNN